MLARQTGSKPNVARAVHHRPITVVVAENHPLLMRGIASVLESEADIELAAQPTNGDDAIAAIKEFEPDVAVLSLYMPGKGALEVLQALAKEQLKTQPVILATRMNEDEFMRAVHLGLRGVVLKEMPTSLLVRCVRTVYSGGDFLQKELFLRAFGKLLRNSDAQRAVAQVLTTRERAVVQDVVSGFSNKEVARRLSISEGTVKVHLHRAYTKLSVRGRMGLLRYAREKGLV